MKSRKFSLGFKTVAKHLASVVFGVMALFGFSQTAALASHLSPNTMPLALSFKAVATSNSPIALAASSRFAADKEFEGQTPTISEQRLDKIREQRREWQSEASAAAAAELDNSTTKDSVGGAIKDKLNLKEITEENEIVDRIKKP